MDKPADSGSVFRGSNPLRGTDLQIKTITTKQLARKFKFLLLSFCYT